MSLAITGVAGFLGQGLLRRLAGTGMWDRIVGLDVVPPAFSPRELDFHLVDIAGSELEPLLEDVDVLVHLAGVHDPTPDLDLMARVNVAGTRRLLDAAAKLTKVVVAGSATVYGAWPNNPVPLTEDAPIRPNPGFALGIHKAEIERLVGEWARAHPGVVTTILRQATVIGPSADHAFARMVRARLSIGIRGAVAPVQFLHEDDAVSALMLSLERDLDGAYNVAADGWLDRPSFRRLLGRRVAPSVGLNTAERALGRLWGAGLVDVPAASVPYLVDPWVVSVDKLRAEGWQPRYSNEEAVRACAVHRPVSWRMPAAGAAAAATGIGVAAAARRRCLRRAR
jgi:UDP-glucose 4-epimerase